MSATTRKRVAVISTGGTIASVRSGPAGELTATVPIGQLLARLGATTGVEIGPVLELARINSWNVDPALMGRLADRVRELGADAGVGGIVITHGSDTLEETAFLLDITTAIDKPVVLTAAMRSADSPDPDGPRNVTAAVRVAGSGAFRGLGVLVCLDQQLHAARWVQKGHTSRCDAFGGPRPALARLDPAGVVGTDQNLTLPRWSAPDAAVLEPDAVPVLQAYTGMTAVVLRAVVAAATPRGIVIEGFGLGHVPAPLVEPIRELLADGVLVVIATRVPAGGTEAVYGGPGGGTELEALGVLAAGTLTAAKARLLLQVCLAGRDPATASGMFRDAVTVLGQDGRQWLPTGADGGPGGADSLAPDVDLGER
jgi:L-asparaginase